MPLASCLFDLVSHDGTIQRCTRANQGNADENHTEMASIHEVAASEPCDTELAGIGSNAATVRNRQVLKGLGPHHEAGSSGYIPKGSTVLPCSEPRGRRNSDAYQQVNRPEKHTRSHSAHTAGCH